MVTPYWCWALKVLTTEQTAMQNTLTVHQAATPPQSCVSRTARNKEDNAVHKHVSCALGGRYTSHRSEDER